MPEELKEISQLGLGGLGIYFLYRIIANHLRHLQENTDKTVVHLEDLKKTNDKHGDKLDDISLGIRELVDLKKEQIKQNGK